MSLRRRPLPVLTADNAARSGTAVLLDTNVYILEAAQRLPEHVTIALRTSLAFHCSVCLAEIANGLAGGDPDNPDWRRLRAHYEAVFGRIPANRLVTPDRAMWADAGIIAGILARIQGYQPWQRKECLNDALVYLCAAKLGAPVLTTDRADFDLIRQIAPEGRILAFAAAAA